MQQRYGRYGITRHQRNAWMIIITVICCLGVGAAALTLFGAMTGHGTLAVGLGPLAGGLLLFAVCVTVMVLSGSPKDSDN